MSDVLPPPRESPERRARAVNHVLVETSALVSLALASAPDHPVAGRHARVLLNASDLLVTTSEALCEAYAAILDRAGARTAMKWLTEIQHSGVGLICPGAREMALGRKLLAEAGDAAYPLSSAIGLAAARRLGIRRVWTYDATNAWVATTLGFAVEA